MCQLDSTDFLAELRSRCNPQNIEAMCQRTLSTPDLPSHTISTLLLPPRADWWRPEAACLFLFWFSRQKLIACFLALADSQISLRADFNYPFLRGRWFFRQKPRRFAEPWATNLLTWALGAKSEVCNWKSHKKPFVDIFFHVQKCTLRSCEAYPLMIWW